MSNKYDSSEHIKVLAELTILYQLVNETNAKIFTLNKQLEKINEQQKAEDDIPF
jgi:uncharacterized Fe-S cluster-containing radical SAM superfamily protein